MFHVRLYRCFLGVVQWYIRLAQLPARIAAAANGVQGKVMGAV
jgi:hypothetical protein